MVIHINKGSYLIKIGEFDFFLNFEVKDYIAKFLKGFISQKADKPIDIYKSSEIKIAPDKIKNKDVFFDLIEKNIKIEGKNIFIPTPITLQSIRFGISKFITVNSKNSFLLHGGGVRNKNGNVNLFIAESGGGKSTICFFNRENVLNDDMIIVTKGKNHFYAQSTPFGYYKKVECGKIENIFFLKKYSENKIEEINVKNSLREILKNVPKNSNYNLLLEMVKKIKTSILCFNLKGEDFVKRL